MRRLFSMLKTTTPINRQALTSDKAPTHTRLIFGSTPMLASTRRRSALGGSTASGRDPRKALTRKALRMPARHCGQPLARCSSNSVFSRASSTPRTYNSYRLAEFLVCHAGATSPNCSRSVFKAVRTQVLTVPSGCFIRAAISDCERPS